MKSLKFNGNFLQMKLSNAPRDGKCFSDVSISEHTFTWLEMCSAYKFTSEWNVRFGVLHQRGVWNSEIEIIALDNLQLHFI